MSEQIIRIVAAVAAVGVFAYPFVAPAATVMLEKLRAPKKPDPIKQKMRDIEFLLELLARFSAMNSKEGVDACQKLIDVLLRPSK